jgi:hypothetical protein
MDDFTTSRYSADQSGPMQVFLDVSELALNLIKSQCKTLKQCFQIEVFLGRTSIITQGLYSTISFTRIIPLI